MRKYSRLSRRWWIGILCGLLLTLFIPFGRADQNCASLKTTAPGASGPWPLVAHNPGRMSYSTLTDITPVGSTEITASPVKAEAQSIAPTAEQEATPTASGDADLFPLGPGRDLTLKVCSSCHAPAIVAKQRLSEQEWSDLVQVMSARGAVATDKELSEITAYLAKSFPPEPAPQH
jgi:hypothetical protein